MDFMHRGGQARTNNVAANSAAAAPAAAATVPGGSGGAGHSNKWVRIGFLTLLFSGTILAIAAILFLALGKGSYREHQFVNKSQLQAVFINVNGTNGGQVYFGNITDMTTQYIRLTNVFYIQNQQSGDSNGNAYNLVKLGCELHGPDDEMIINRGEVFFWENLKSDSQVAQKVAEFHKQNPDGQKCNTANAQQQQQQSSNTQQQSNTSTQAPATNTTTNNTTNTNSTTAPKTTTNGR